MELNEETFKGNWAENPNTHNRFFIINEAIIEKLCILGEDHEPCFEGAQFKTTFSLHDEFEQLKQSMYELVQDMLKQGGFNNPMDNENNVTPTQENSTPETEFEKKKPEDENKGSDNQEGKNNESNSSENKGNTEENNSNSEEDKDKKKKYSLDEIEEYQTLKGEYAILQRQYAALEQEKNALATEIEPLRTFKAQAEKAKKEALINSFYMLSDEDKSDVVKNIDTYSLEEIESKLAVIGVRKKINFGLSQETADNTPPQQEENNLLFNLQGAAESMNNDVPAWIRAVQETEKNL